MVIANSRDCCNKSRNPDAACRGRRQCPHRGRSGCLRRFHTSSLRSSTAQVAVKSSRPEIKGAAARMIEPGVVPVAGRNGILDAGTVEWKTPYGHSLVAGSTTLWRHDRVAEARRIVANQSSAIEWRKCSQLLIA